MLPRSGRKCWRGSGLVTERLLNLGQQGGTGEWFLQECGASLRYTAMRDRVRRIARHEDGLEAESLAAKAIGKLLAIATLQHHVGEEKIDFAAALSRTLQGLFMRFRGDYLVASREKELGDHFAQRGVVFHKENGCVIEGCSRGRDR